MAKRKALSQTLRWQIFARDGFACRYCGVQAGQGGVVLNADHLVSVADGGNNSVNNLVTACADCNSGKQSRSLRDIPTPAEVVQRIEEWTASLQSQADAIKTAIAAEANADQMAVDLKCAAFGLTEVGMAPGEARGIRTLCLEHGADLVLDWYVQTAGRRIPESESLAYVRGIVRKRREQGELD